MHILIVRQNKDEIGPIGNSRSRRNSRPLLFIRMLEGGGDDGESHEGG